MKLSFGQIFLTVAVAGVIAAIGLIIKQLAHPESSPEHAVSVDEAHGHKLEGAHGGHLD
jgi:AAHS family 4-hydroxybenzoate transporter-like MFS transporter